MMAFVFSAARFNADNSVYFEQFFLSFLERRGIKYAIVDIDDENKLLIMVKPWDRDADIHKR
jgi:hypothetical protein